MQFRSLKLYRNDFWMKTWPTIYWRNKKLAQLKRWPALLGDPFLWFAPNRSRTNFSSNTNTFGLTRRVNPVKARKPEHAQVPLLSALRSGKEVHFFLVLTLAKVDSAGKVTVLPGTTFLYIKRALSNSNSNSLFNSEFHRERVFHISLIIP